MGGRQQQRTAKGSGPNGRLTKAERRDLARRQREDLRRRMARARRNRRIATAAILAAVIGGGVWIASAGDDAPPDANAGPLPGMMTGAQPWSANLTDVAARVDRLDLPSAGVAMHIHSYLALTVDGEQVPVPADVGWSDTTHAPIHSHDTTGIIHVESGDAAATFTLGEYFDVWGLRLSSSCLGGYCEDGKRSVRAFVDGEPFTGDPRQIQLADQEEITIAYGTERDVPDPLPTFDWSELRA